MWQRLAPDAQRWLSGGKMSMALWNGFRAIVLSSPAFKATPHHLKDEFIPTLTEWLARSILFQHSGPCLGDKRVDSGRRKCKDEGLTTEEVMLKYTRSWVRNSMRYLFVLQLSYHGVNIAGTYDPVKFVYQGRLHFNAGNPQKRFTELRKEGLDPWKMLDELVTDATLPYEAALS